MPPGGARKEFRNELFFCYVSENEHINDLKVQGKSVREIASLLGLSKSKVWQLTQCLLEKHATPEARAAHIDLADWLIQYLEDKNA